MPNPPLLAAGCSLYGNQIGDAGATALSEVLKSNTTLTSLG
jgi:hypothetical protein